MLLEKKPEKSQHWEDSWYSKAQMMTRASSKFKAFEPLVWTNVLLFLFLRHLTSIYVLSEISIFTKCLPKLSPDSLQIFFMSTANRNPPQYLVSSQQRFPLVSCSHTMRKTQGASPQHPSQQEQHHHHTHYESAKEDPLDSSVQP